MIKKVWLTDIGHDLFTLSIRQFPNDLEMVHNKSELPPTEDVNGKRIGIDEAKRLNLVELHHGLGVFTIDDLVKLRQAIDEVLYE
jgi:hypothetical protein